MVVERQSCNDDVNSEQLWTTNESDIAQTFSTDIVFSLRVTILIMFYSYNYIPLLVTLLDVPEGLDCLLQRVASIND